jgi:hypothetical protein
MGQSPDPGALIAGVNVAASVMNSVYGDVPLSKYELGIVVSVCTRALRNHLDRQIADLNERLGVPRDAPPVPIEDVKPTRTTRGQGRKPAEQIELPLGSTQGAAEGAEV